MLSPPHASTGSTQDHLIWQHWKHDHPEFRRAFETRITFNGDKILIIGGLSGDSSHATVNLILVDPETQKFQIIPSVGDDLASICLKEMSACYWKDSKVIISGGYQSFPRVFSSTVTVVTLKDLDSDHPSAHWERMVTPTELFRARHSAHIYQDKMYVCGGMNEINLSTEDIWCLDLSAFTWSKCDFRGFPRKSDPNEDPKYVFHEKKVYVIQSSKLAEVDAIHELDLDTMTSKSLIFPKTQANSSRSFAPFPQVMNGKIYFLQIPNQQLQDSPQIKQVLAFDLDSRNLIETKTESFEDRKVIGRVVCCNNHLVFSPTLVDHSFNFGEFWSAKLATSKKTSAPLNKSQETMKDFFFEAPYSDISFEVESQIIPAHKWWLIQKNKFFANMFASGMSEAQASTIKITDMKASTFRALLEFLYVDYVELDNSLALDLLQQADKYSVGELKNTCEKHLIANIEAGNYVTLGQIAELLEASSLREAVVAFIAKNIKTLKQRKDFDEISDGLLRDSLVKFIVK